MTQILTSKYNRRGIFKGTLGLLAGGLLGPLAERAEAQPAVKNVNRNSSPSTLKITDLRYTIVKKPGPSPCPIIRIDTNQGVYGLGEVRDVANYQYAMVLKSRIVGENPLNVDYLFEKIAQFGGVSRQAGGVVAIEMALWDIVGKVYNIPIYQMLGGKWRDKIRIYADTPEADTPQEFAAIAKERKDRGLTWIKVDVGPDLLKGKPGTIMEPADQRSIEYDKRLPHAFTGNELTDKGIAVYCEYISTIREAIGYEIPLSTDHLGHLGVKSIIRLGRAYEKYNLEWMEDVIPWWYTELLKEITDASPTPTLTGEDIYEIADFEKLCSNHAVDKIHPDFRLPAVFCGPTRSATWLTSMVCRWRCTLRELRLRAWPMCTALRRAATSLRLRITRLTFRGGTTSSTRSTSPSSIVGISLFLRQQVLA